MREVLFLSVGSWSLHLPVRRLAQKGRDTSGFLPFKRQTGGAGWRLWAQVRVGPGNPSGGLRGSFPEETPASPLAGWPTHWNESPVFRYGRAGLSACCRCWATEPPTPAVSLPCEEAGVGSTKAQPPKSEVTEASGPSFRFPPMRARQSLSSLPRPRLTRTTVVRLDFVFLDTIGVTLSPCPDGNHNYPNAGENIKLFSAVTGLP